MECATISNYGMSVDDEAKVERIMAQAVILVLDAFTELLGAVGTSTTEHCNMCRRNNTPRGKQW